MGITVTPPETLTKNIISEQSAISPERSLQQREQLQRKIQLCRIDKVPRLIIVLVWKKQRTFTCMNIIMVYHAETHPTTSRPHNISYVGCPGHSSIYAFDSTFNKHMVTDRPLSKQLEMLSHYSKSRGNTA